MLKVMVFATLILLSAGSADAVVRFEGRDGASADFSAGFASASAVSNGVFDSFRRDIGYAEAGIDASIEDDSDEFESDAFVWFDIWNDDPAPRRLGFEIDYVLDGFVDPGRDDSLAYILTTIIVDLQDANEALVMRLFEDGFREDTDALRNFGGPVPIRRIQPVSFVIPAGEFLRLRVDVESRAGLEDFAEAGGRASVIVYASSVSDVTPVPVPAALPLLGTALAALAAVGARRRRQNGA